MDKSRDVINPLAVEQIQPIERLQGVHRHSLDPLEMRGIARLQEVRGGEYRPSRTGDQAGPGTWRSNDETGNSGE